MGGNISLMGCSLDDTQSHLYLCSVRTRWVFGFNSPSVMTHCLGPWFPFDGSDCWTSFVLVSVTTTTWCSPVVNGCTKTIVKLRGESFSSSGSRGQSLIPLNYYLGIISWLNLLCSTDAFISIWSFFFFLNFWERKNKKKYLEMFAFNFEQEPSKCCLIIHSNN